MVCPQAYLTLDTYRLGIDDGRQACGEGPRDGVSRRRRRPLVNNTRFRDLKALVDYGHKAGSSMDFYQINCIWHGYVHTQCQWNVGTSSWREM